MLKLPLGHGVICAKTKTNHCKSVSLSLTLNPGGGFKITNIISTLLSLNSLLIHKYTPLIINILLSSQLINLYPALIIPISMSAVAYFVNKSKLSVYGAVISKLYMLASHYPSTRFSITHTHTHTYIHTHNTLLHIIRKSYLLGPLGGM